MTGIAVHERQHRVREDTGERIEREHVFGRLQDPASRRRARALEMTEKPPQESVALVIAGLIEPGARRRSPPSPIFRDQTAQESAARQ